MIHIRTQQGFSLIEVLVAISILLLVVVGPMQILTRANNSTTFASEQIVAFYLAQEGIELVEKRRDDLLLQYFRRQFNGSGGITDPMQEMKDGATLANCFSSNGCAITVNSNANAIIPTAQECGSNLGSCRLYYGAGRTAYTHTANSNPSPFTRQVRIEAIPSTGTPREFRVTSTVTWRTGSLISGQEVKLVSYLANTYDTP